MANGAWRGNLSQTAIDRKPLQTDKLTGRAFDDEVYAVVAQIPAGKIVSYKQIARLIGMPDHARRVGRAMASGTAGESTGNPAGKGIRPTPPDTIARQAAATYRRKKFGIPRQNRYLRITPHTLRAYCGGQYSPPGMRLSGKSTA